MFKEQDNFGDFLQGIAKTLCIIEIIIWIIVSIIIFSNISDAPYSMETTLKILGFTSLIGGTLCSYLSCLVLYAIGEIIYQLTKSNDTSQNMNNKVVNSVKYNSNIDAHQWRCSSCGNMISQDICPYCHNNQ